MRAPVLFTITGILLALSPAAGAQEKVILVAADSHPLVASYFPPSGATKGGVLLLHMYRTSRLSYEPLAARLAAQGFHVVALDMRGHGSSRKDASGRPIDISRSATREAASNPFLKMHQDAEAAFDLLLKRGAPSDRLAIVGASVGCSVALHTATLHPKRVAAIVLLTPGTNYLGVPSKEHAPRYGDRPALILSSEEEADQGARSLKSLMTGKQVKLRILPHKRIHGTNMFGKVPGIEADIIQWLEESLVVRAVLEIPYETRVLVELSYRGFLGDGSIVHGLAAAVRVPF